MVKRSVFAKGKESVERLIKKNEFKDRSRIIDNP